MNKTEKSPTTLLDPSKRQRCEVWTRVMGYYRPVSQFNAGKKSEHRERLHFREPGVKNSAVA
jgi:anaerobic ribonucleoside-triphosphate reductase